MACYYRSMHSHSAAMEAVSRQNSLHLQQGSHDLSAEALQNNVDTSASLQKSVTHVESCHEDSQCVHNSRLHVDKVAACRVTDLWKWEECR